MMDNAVKERLVGAAVLVLLVVIVVPALLSGPREPAPSAEADAPDAAMPAGPASEVRVVEIDLTGKQGQAATPTLLDPVESPAAIPAPGPESGAQAPAVDNAAGVMAQTETPSEPPQEGPQQTAEPSAPPAAGWAVQVAALSSGEAAAKMAADLRGKGYSAFVLEHRADGRVLYRVRVGPESQRERAVALAARLQDEGLTPTVVAHP
jgi:DedD protein